MKYIDSLDLINLSIEHEVLKNNNHGNVYVYRKEGIKGFGKEGWYLTDKGSLAKELMTDTTCQTLLIADLKKRSLEILPFKF